MTLNLVKLSVGSESVESLTAWIAHRLAQCRARGVPQEYFHTTRMVPRRGDELLKGGSIYWVIKGQIQCRQCLTGIRAFTGDDGVSRCHLMLEPVLVPTQWAPRRPFQGWRYLTSDDAPADLGNSGSTEALPQDLERDLASLGLL